VTAGAPDGWREVGEVEVDPARALVHEEGWQSWSPTGAYGLHERPVRGSEPHRYVMNYKDRAGLGPGLAGEGLLAVDPGTGGPVRVWAATDPTRELAEIRAELRGDRLVVSADGPVEASSHPGGLQRALGEWADGYAGRLRSGSVRPAPTIWCSWYHYFTQVSEADVVENLDAMDRLDLPVDVVQLDDGYQSELGDWLTLSDRFASLPALSARVRDRGRRAGIWVAPFLVGARSEVARTHPEWLVRGPEVDDVPVEAGHNWGQVLYALDTTHPGAADYLTEVFGTFAGQGFDFFKIDFVYAGALPGVRHEDVPPVVAYRRGVETIRAAVGDAYVLGCGAPVLPSIGLVDAMRVGPDIALHYEPEDGDLVQPSQRTATRNVRARAYQQGRFWVNDPDCLVARPAMERREEWAGQVEQYGGLRGSSDRLAELDGWGLETTRRLLSTVPPPTPFDLTGSGAGGG
jgi:alpha-galactosidase